MASQIPRPCIVWFRDDLRLSDHPALHAASKTGAPVICLYVLDEQAATRGRSAARRAGGWRNRCAPCRKAWRRSARRWCCARDRRRRSSPNWRARPTPARCSGTRSRRRRIRPWPIRSPPRCRKSASPRKAFPAICWWRPQTSATRKAGACGCSRRSGSGCRALGDPPKPLPAPKTLCHVPGIASDPLESWHLEPTHPDWAGGLRETWTPGEASAQARLRQFLERRLAGYSTDRDRPDREGTSRLSPHLRFGEISPRQVWHAARFAAAEHPTLAGDIDKFLSELGWREFCRHLLFDVPDLATATCSPHSTPFPGNPTPRRCGPGSAARPAIPSSMPACASSGTPA